MAQLVLGAVGAVVGFYVGGPTGASYGWMAGVALGGALDPQNTQTAGPRLTDLKVQSSAYGGMKPVIYGAMRTNGNVIFCTDKREVATESTSSAGKGGPTVTNTTYTYNVDIAIALCANPILGIRKIWNNGQLIYDMSSGASLATVMASSTNSAGFKLYTGSETQLPDPTLEATLGAGNVPGYRGIAYVVFTQLDCPNGQIPQLSFEVVESGALVSPPLNDITVRWSDKWTPGTPQWCDVSTRHVEVVSYTDSSPDHSKTYSTLLDSVHTRFGLSAANMGSQFASRDEATNSSGPYMHVDSQDFSSGDFTIEAFVYLDPAKSFAGGWLFNVGGNGWGYAYPADMSDLRTRGCLSCWIEPTGLVRFFTGYAYDFARSNPSQEFNATIPVGVLTHLTIQRIGSTILIGVDGVNASRAIQYAPVANGAGAEFRIGGIFNQATPVYQPTGCFVGTWLEFRISLGVGRYGFGSYKVPDCPFGEELRVAPTDSPLAAIIGDICARAGLAGAQIDTSALADTVTGYALTQVSAARANLLPVQQYGFVDGIESDGVLKWTPRAARTSVATVPYDDLAAEQAGTAPGDPLALQRTQEVDLPRSVALNYLNTAADYQSGTETARRSVTGSANDVVVQLPMATTAARAAQAADVQLHDAWNERNQYTTKVPRKYAFLDAGDVITVEHPQGVYTAKRLTQANDTGQLVELTLVDSDAAIYAPTASGASPAQAQVGVSLASPTALALLDIPILRDADDNAGLYTAMAGYASPWPGAVLYLGPDDAGLAPRGGVTQPAVIGAANSALGAWSAGIMDQTNSVLVTLIAGSLASATRDAVFDTGANVAALGAPGRWEIIAFTTAVPVGGTQYQLSGLLRGLRGTEAQAGTHQVGDTFVLLQTAGMLRPLFDLAELNQPRQFRAVTTGQSINSAGSISGTNSGAGIKPFNPVNLRRSTDASNNITLTWDRRTRSSVTFPPGSGADVPLFEASEAYSIDVYSNNTFATVVRTLSAAAPSCTYTAAQQTADGLTPGAAVNVRVYQVSANAGRGSPLQGSI